MGTKAKRAQAVILRHPLTIDLLRYVVQRPRPGERLFAYSYSTYRKLLTKVESELGLEMGWTPHSPRAGFASESIQDGCRFGETKEAGRWVADSSLRTYIDLVACEQIVSDLRIAGLLPVMKHASAHLTSFFLEI